jgi:hypothetical protein
MALATTESRTSPEGAEELVDTIEDKEIYEELERLNVDVKKIKGFNPTHEEIRNFLEGLKECEDDKIWSEMLQVQPTQC